MSTIIVDAVPYTKHWTLRNPNLLLNKPVGYQQSMAKDLNMGLPFNKSSLTVSNDHGGSLEYWGPDYKSVPLTTSPCYMSLLLELFNIYERL